MMPATRNPPANDQTIVQLVSGIGTSAKDLLSAHGTQLKAEVREQATQAALATAAVAGAAFCLVLAGAFLLVALVNVLIEFLGWPPSASWAAVGALIGVLGIVLGLLARRHWQHFNLLPTGTLRSMQESWSWIINHRK
jgi:hypothetical protein